MHHLQHEQENQLLHHLQQHELDMQDDEMMNYRHLQHGGDLDSDGVEQMQDDDYHDEECQEEPLGFTSSASKDPLMW